MKQLPIVVLRGCPCVGAPLYIVHVPVALVGELDLNTSPIFPQGVLAAIILVGGGAGDGGGESWSRV